jgi:colanic acid biosynthesis glycosyl transferase WcaI
MNIVVVTICYPPEIRSISIMVREFCESLVEQGHSVTVLTGWPQYNLSEGDQQRTFDVDSIENGVRIIRIKTLPTHKVAYMLRGVAQLLLPPLFLRACKKYIKDIIDSVVVYSPHLPLTQVGARIKKQHGAKFLLNIQDIFPQGAIDLGILRQPQAIKFFERMERKAYDAADSITTCTHRAREFLMEKKSVPSEKIIVVPNWIDIAPYDNVTSAQTSFRKSHGLEDSFLVVFPGVLGPTQGLDFILDVAKELQTSNFKLQTYSVKFLFVGDGTEGERLKERVRTEGLTNVLFWSFVSPDDYPKLLNEADVGLLSLRKDCKTPTVPGKLFGFLAASLPVMAFLNPESEGHRMIKEANCGIAMVSDDIGRAAESVRQFISDSERLNYFGRNGRVYVENQFTKESCINQLVEKL